MGERKKERKKRTLVVVSVPKWSGLIDNYWKNRVKEKDLTAYHL